MSRERATAIDFEASLEALTSRCEALTGALRRVLVGADALIEGLLVCLVAGGHGLIEGPPGVGKTLAVKALSSTLGLRLTRVQMTPDLMPSDLIGGSVITQGSDGAPTLSFQEGPIFTELLFADELNRANPKTQAALLEAMAERQVSVEGETRPLGAPFFVFATQNPVELEGTFTLPVAQADRFLCRLLVNLPSEGTLKALLCAHPSAALSELSTREPLITPSALLTWPKVAAQVITPDHLMERLVKVVMLTRPERAPDDLKRQLTAGVSPRAAQDLLAATRARAAIMGRPFTRDEDLEAVAPLVLAHRVSLTWEARAEGTSPVELISTLVEQSAREPL